MLLTLAGNFGKLTLEDMNVAFSYIKTAACAQVARPMSRWHLAGCSTGSVGGIF